MRITVEAAARQRTEEERVSLLKISAGGQSRENKRRLTVGAR